MYTFPRPFVVTYNLNKYHSQVKESCLDHGFSDAVKCDDGRWRDLPNTTLVGVFATAQEAQETFVDIARAAAPDDLVIGPVLACPLEPGYVMPKELDPRWLGTLMRLGLSA